MLNASADFAVARRSPGTRSLGGITSLEDIAAALRLGDRVIMTMFLVFDLGETFYEALRESVLLAGAIDGEIDAVAQLFITAVVEGTEPDSEERVSQFELITDHLACTRVRICLNQADTVLSVEFPYRQRVQ